MGGQRRPHLLRVDLPPTGRTLDIGKQKSHHSGRSNRRHVDKPARTRRHRVPALAARTIAALVTLRDQVIAPILAGVRSPKMGRKPTHWTRVDRDYERIRIVMQTLFTDLAIETPLAA